MKPTVGDQLRSARESKGISLEDVVKATHIRLHYLQELENDHPELLNSPVQARGFLRLYAEFLDLPFTQLLEQWQADVNGVAQDVAVEQQNDHGESQSSETGSSAAAGEKETQPKFSLTDFFSRLPKISTLFSRKKPITGNSARSEKKGSGIGTKPENMSEPALVPSQNSSEIFNEIGAALRERRLALELTLSDVERFTNVKRMYLNAMEIGRFEELPSSVQGRGMLNNYSKFIALDESALMDNYARALQAQRSERTQANKRTIQSPLIVKLNIPEKWRRILNPDLILGGLFIVAMFAFILWGSAQVFSGGNPTPTEAPSISEMLQQTPSLSTLLGYEITQTAESLAVEVTPIPGVVVIESTPTQIATINAAPLQLYIIAHDRAYVSIIVDGVQAFDGRVLPDNVYTYSGQNSIELVTGNGAALEAYFNQEFLGGLGDVGEVVRINFSEQGLSTPTPQTTPTPDAALLEP
ncbi:MAG: helix-turn-helix domain-containing protein [Pelolinea sp.]|nr:helix-turn-helix domain-containing protein [Pelolinea sp.]